MHLLRLHAQSYSVESSQSTQYLLLSAVQVGALWLLLLGWWWEDPKLFVAKANVFSTWGAKRSALILIVFTFFSVFLALSAVAYLGR